LGDSYAFRRHFYQHAGFRYIESDAPVVVKERIAAPEPEVARWADAHYGQTYLGVANYSSALVSHVTSTIDAYERRSTSRTTSRNIAAVSASPPLVSSESKGESKKADGITGVGHEGRRRAVDIGCAAGRASFELGRHYDSVLGLDFSTRFFRVATQLQQEGVFRYELPLSGELTSYHSISLEEMGLEDAAKRVEFLQADACNMDPKYRDFDLVMASNLLSHLYAPAKFIDHIRSRLRPGAFLVIAETWDWKTDTTPRDAWLGGYKEAGETVSNLDGLERKLGSDFTMIAPPHELQWLVRRSERSFDHHISQVTIWRLRA
jgi:putative 4-mercaptohistidine N1-methyltranferase